jgi:hypothetical protein
MKILDTRELNARLNTLEERYSDIIDLTIMEVPEDKYDEVDPDEFEEMKELQQLRDEIPEWRDGNTMVPEDGWVDYVQDLCEDIGDIPKNLPNYIAIDWEKTASNIAFDYGTIEYQGDTYYYRNC